MKCITSNSKIEIVILHLNHVLVRLNPIASILIVYELWITSLGGLGYV